MIYFKLSSPVILDQQLNGLSLLLRIEEKCLKRLLYCGAEVVTEDFPDCEKGSILTNKELVEKEIPESIRLTGSEAILWLLKEKGIEEQPLSEINIPVSVLDHCTKKQKMDIIEFASSVARRNERLARLSEMGAPAIILKNEKRVLKEKVELLEHNNLHGNPIRHQDGTICRALNDVGYSLVNGWDAGMLLEFEKRSKEIEKRMEECATEGAE